MSLLSYFHVAPRVLPNPSGPLSAELSPSTITEANAAVNGVQQAKTKGSKKRGTYIKYDEKMKIKMGKHSSENGIHAAARHFSFELGRNINPSTIRGFKKAYLQEIDRAEDRARANTVPDIRAWCVHSRAPPTTAW